MRRGAAILLLTLAGAPVARADLPAPAHRASGARAVRNSRSVGAPQEGRLENARRLHESDSVHYLVAAASRGRHFGTDELVEVLVRGAAAVAGAFPGSALRVGDMSAKSGGDVHMHASHESGRDVDVAFYLRTPGGQDAQPPEFVTIGLDARSADGAFVFDDERNWAFVEAVLADRRAVVTHVFIADFLRERLLAQARAVGAPAALLARAASLLTQPRGSFPHDNHLHLRVACAADDKPECIEGLPRRRRGRAR